MTERERQILEAARDLFLVEGLDGLSMRKVAARVGVTAPAIYRHFRNKEALVMAMIDAGIEQFGRYLFRGIEAPDAKSRLLRTGEQYLLFAFECPRDYQLIFMSWDVLKPVCEGTRTKQGPNESPTFQFLMDRVAECIRTGLFRVDLDLFEVAISQWALCHGLATLYLKGGAAEHQNLEGYKQMCLRVLRLSAEGLQ